MNRFRVASEIWQAFPDVLLGVVEAHDIDNRGDSAEVITALRNEEQKVREQFAATSIIDHPHIASWREAYRKFGAKPKDYPSSVENLVRRVVKGHSISHINKLVDIYNVICLRYIVPVGGEDLDRIQGDIVLTFAGPNEAQITLLGEKEERAPKPGEVIYKDDVGAICRRWNWKEAERTKLTKNTTHGFLITEILPPFDQDFLQRALEDLCALIREYCGGVVSSEIVRT